jgi:hypothetical protein
MLSVAPSKAVFRVSPVSRYDPRSRKRLPVDEIVASHWADSRTPYAGTAGVRASFLPRILKCGSQIEVSRPEIDQIESLGIPKGRIF